MSSTAPPFAPLAQPHIESSVKRVRVLFGGKYVVDTTQAKLVYVISSSSVFTLRPDLFHNPIQLGAPFLPDLFLPHIGTESIVAPRVS